MQATGTRHPRDCRKTQGYKKKEVRRQLDSIRAIERVKRAVAFLYEYRIITV
mgnify:CR=1 FL=1